MYSTYTAFPTPVNDQITDSVTQGFFKAESPPYYYSTYTTTSSSSCFRIVTKFEDEVDDGYKIIANVAGAAKENITVNYLPEDGIIRLSAKIDVEDIQQKIDVAYAVPCKFDLDSLKCSLKNGLLTILIPYKDKYKPKEAKIS